MATLTNKEKKINKTLSIVAWIFLAIGMITLLWFYFYSRAHVNTNDAQIKQYITPVASKVSGYIQEVNFKENQEVKKGDTLVVIDNREYKNQVQAAQAYLESTAQSVSSVERSVDSKASVISIVQAEIEAAKVDVWKTEKEYQRFKNLLKDQAATEQQFETAEAEYRKAKAKYTALEQQKNSVNVNTSAELAKVAPVKSQVNQQKANVNNAQLNLSYTYIVAPYDGWVGTKNIQPGQFVQAGQALVQVVSKEKWVVANFKETQLFQIDTTKPIVIHVDAYPDVAFEANMESISPASGSEFSLIKPDYATGNFVKIEQRFPVRILFKEHPDLIHLRTGMNVTVSAEKR